MSSSSEGVKQGERMFQEGIPLAWSPMSLQALLSSWKAVGTYLWGLHLSTKLFQLGSLQKRFMVAMTAFYL